jgi:hypothetical protein
VLQVTHDRGVLADRCVLVAPEHHKGGNGTPPGHLHDVDAAEHLVTRERVLQVPRRDGGVVGLAEGLQVLRALLGCILGTVTILSAANFEEYQPLGERGVLGGTRQAHDRSPGVSEQETDAA